MHDVLFKTDAPTCMQELAEYYELCLFQQVVEGRRLSYVRESHGWWDNRAGRAIDDHDATLQSKAFEDYRDAFERYCRQRQLYIDRGFIHSFLWHRVSGAPTYHQQIDSL